MQLLRLYSCWFIFWHLSYQLILFLFSSQHHLPDRWQVRENKIYLNLCKSWNFHIQRESNMRWQMSLLYFTLMHKICRVSPEIYFIAMKINCHQKYAAAWCMIAIFIWNVWKVSRMDWIFLKISQFWCSHRRN